MKVKSHHPGLHVQGAQGYRTHKEKHCTQARNQESSSPWGIRILGLLELQTWKWRLPPKMKTAAWWCSPPPQAQHLPSQDLHTSCVWPVVLLSRIFTLAFITSAPQECWECSTVELSTGKQELVAAGGVLLHGQHFPHSGPRCPNYGLQVLVCCCNTFHAG